MKIRIAEEYVNLGEDFNIVVDEYSKETDVEKLESEFEESSGYYNSNNGYESENNNGFKVEIQYLEEDITSSNYYEKNNYNTNSNKNNINGEDETYIGTSNDKYKEYDKFCHNQEINYNYDSNIVYDEPLNSNTNFEYEKNVDGKKYEDCNCDGDNNRESFNFIEESNMINANRKIDDISNCTDECEVSDNECENYNNTSEMCYQKKCVDNYDDNYLSNCKSTKGEIKVCVKLGDKNGIEIKGAKINLYELNGVCPKLYESKLTNCNGEVTFDDLEDGCYRVISIVDRRFFEKPLYISWNEVTIDSCVKSANICVVNRLKPSCLKR